MLARVSSLETFRRWRENEDTDAQTLIDSLTLDEPTDAMKAGTAFHAALERASEGITHVLTDGGYSFDFDIDAEISLPELREIRATSKYGPLLVTGKFDALDGRTIIDHKTTAHFDAERYVSGYQWRYYLDIFGCNTFRWNVFEIREIEPRTYMVQSYHRLEQSRYPGMHEDCMRLALEFHDVVSELLPEYQSRLEAA